MIRLRRLLLLALGLICGYALRRPAVCEREHSLPRHLDPAIVNREGDEGIQPPDPRTWPVLCVCGTQTGDIVFHAPSATWPETLKHEGDHGSALGQRIGCPRCDADRWLRGGRRA